MTLMNRQYVLARRPTGALQESDFTWQEAAIPEPGPGEALVRSIYLSLDPANRGWVNDVPTYRPPVGLGEPMAGFVIGQVVASNREDLAAGDLVEGDGGWQDYAVYGADDDVVKLPPGEDLIARMSVRGVTGLTAYWGLLDIGQPRTGETVVVSAAAGAVGSIVGQIAKIKGCRVVGLAGSDEKCQWIVDDLGFDAAINYKTENVLKVLGQHCPDGIDIYFDNTGGDILQAALFRMNQGGRIVCCGVVSQYDTATPLPGPHGMPGLLVVRRLRMEGFIVMDYDDRRAEADADLTAWVAEGRLKYKIDMIEGLENAPRGLIGLLHGENTGKRMIRVSEEP
ncbi:MAG: NADP-dependent oxidoreductase [Rhodospirillaceae bacterium]|nr:NADP-dependent oxidoreductase [Rhodospirillaceae bacterium]MBT6428664.1 NADP-dependent oxidoreductase [Rhodospirillaceae bacterium]